MAQFGWAYVDCADAGTVTGPTGSVLFITGSNAASGSTNLLFLTSSNTLVLTGTLVIEGTITASSFVVDQTNTISGSTIFGNSTNDTHKITGSLFVGASASASTFTVNPTTNQSINSGVRVKYRTITSAGTSSTSDYILGFGGSGALEFRIHSASAAGSGSILVFKDELSSRTGAITLSASSGNTIDGSSHYEITGSSPAISLYSNGVNGWFVF
jgi:hypothetical protein